MAAQHYARMKKVLFLCTGNSCRSIMAEAMLSHLGGERFLAFSAGSFPTGTINALTLETLRNRGIKTAGLRSKSWEEFANKPIDWVITVCDNAAGEACPLFPGQPLKAHWGVADPAKFQGTDQARKQVFERTVAILEHRIKAMLRLPLGQMPVHEIKSKINEIGETQF